jgi:HK97 family phage prohead protease
MDTMPARFISKLLPTSTELLADGRRVRVICSTDGIALENYRKNPIVLWGHDADTPVAKAVEIGIAGGKLQATVEFPAEGKDAEADWVYGKIKAGIVNATSVGFQPLEVEPIDIKEPWGGFRFTKSELLEFSFVSVPANQDCLIVGRSIFTTAKAPMIDPDECPEEDCPMRNGEEGRSLSPDRLARILGLPGKFRELAKMLPDKAHGARGQLLRCANIAAREIGGEQEPPAATPHLDAARQRLAALRGR